MSGIVAIITDIGNVIYRERWDLVVEKINLIFGENISIDAQVSITK